MCQEGFPNAANMAGLRKRYHYWPHSSEHFEVPDPGVLVLRHNRPHDLSETARSHEVLCLLSRFFGRLDLPVPVTEHR